MARRVTPAQYKQMVAKYNREVKQHNAKVKKQFDEYNRAEKKRVSDYNKQVNSYNKSVNKAINVYNRQVRQYNSAQKSKRIQLNSNIQKFNQSITTSSPSTTILRESTQVLESRYQKLSVYTENNELNNNSSLLLDHPVQETNNSIQLYNSISGNDLGDFIQPSELQWSPVEDSLYSISAELGKRWGGALYSLNPQNPDAARHFCTSVREIFIQLIELKAPDENVFGLIPNCGLHNGKPNRRSKIQYLLTLKSIESSTLCDFVEADIDDLLEFFKTLNDGTHGGAGKYDVQQLLKIKKRAEDSIIFISALG